MTATCAQIVIVKSSCIMHARHMRLRVRELRKQAGWTQVELSDKSGLSHAWISRVESGEGNWTRETIQVLAKTFGVREIELFDAGVSPAATEAMQLVESLTDGGKAIAIAQLRALAQVPGMRKATESE